MIKNGQLDLILTEAKYRISCFKNYGYEHPDYEQKYIAAHVGTLFPNKCFFIHMKFCLTVTFNFLKIYAVLLVIKNYKS